MSTLNITGQRLDILIRKGVDTGSITFSIKNDDGTLVNLGDFTATGAIYRNADKLKMVDWSISTPDEYHFSVNLTHEQLAELSTSSEDYPQYFHEINLINGAGLITPFVYGDFVSVWSANP